MIYQAATARRLALFRIAVLSWWVWELVRDPFHRLAEIPVEWFDPHGPWLLVPDVAVRAVWSEGGLLALRGVTLAAVALALLGARGSRAWAVLATLLLCFVTAFIRGFGHADHAHVQLLLVTVALTATPAWDELVLSRVPRPIRPAGSYTVSFAVLALVFTFPYFETGAHRLAREGGRIFFGSSLLHFLARDTGALDDFSFTQGFWLVERGEWLPAYNLAFAAVTVAELAAPWAHLGRRPCLVWLSVLLPFHLLAPVLMHVFFPANVALLGLLYAWPLSWKQPTAADASALRAPGNRSGSSDAGMLGREG